MLHAPKLYNRSSLSGQSFVSEYCDHSVSSDIIVVLDI
jgi:hypothetical protein